MFCLSRAFINTRNLAWCLFLELIVLGVSESFYVQMLPLGCTFCGGGLNTLTGWCLLISGTSKGTEPWLCCCRTAPTAAQTLLELVMDFVAAFDHAVVLCSWRLVPRLHRVVFVCWSVFLCTLLVCRCVEGISLCCMFSRFDISWRIGVRDSLTVLLPASFCRPLIPRSCLSHFSFLSLSGVFSVSSILISAPLPHFVPFL